MDTQEQSNFPTNKPFDGESSAPAAAPQPRDGQAEVQSSEPAVPVGDPNEQQAGSQPKFVIEEDSRRPVIKVIGIGGGGGNAVQHMMDKQLYGVEFVAMNTDVQALSKLGIGTKLPIGDKITEGLGAGAKPKIGENAALEDADQISEILEGAHMVFVAAGMGGGTGTGAAPVVARLAREKGILTVAVVTKPFEMELRDAMAEAGLAALEQQVDSMIVISNEKLYALSTEELTVENAFAAADDVLYGAVEGIADVILRPGRINTDFADVKTVMSTKGLAMMGSGRAAGKERAREATEAAISCPLLDGVDINGAQGILVNITAGPSLTIPEFQEILARVRECASDQAEIIRGWILDPKMEDDLKVTVIATGLGKPPSLAVDNTSLEREPNYPDFEDPTWRRRGEALRAQSAAPAIDPLSAAPEGDVNYLDVPTFLRRQVD